jgi:hypothetical protein
VRIHIAKKPVRLDETYSGYVVANSIDVGVVVYESKEGNWVIYEPEFVNKYLLEDYLEQNLVFDKIWHSDFKLSLGKVQLEQSFAFVRAEKVLSEKSGVLLVEKLTDSNFLFEYFKLEIFNNEQKG